MDDRPDSHKQTNTQALICIASCSVSNNNNNNNNNNSGVAQWLGRRSLAGGPSLTDA